MLLTSGGIQLPTVFFSVRGSSGVSVTMTLLVGVVGEQSDGISASSASASSKFLICSMKPKMIHERVNGDFLAGVIYQIGYGFHVGGKIVHDKVSQRVSW